MLEYVVVTLNDARGVELMTSYSPSTVSVHTEPNYIIWVWHDATNEQVAFVTDSSSIISTVYIGG